MPAPGPGPGGLGSGGGDSDAGDAVSMPLRHAWSFFFDDGNFHHRASQRQPTTNGSIAPIPDGASVAPASDFLSHLVPLGEFHSIQKFWLYFNSVDLNIHRICRHGRFNLCLFKQGVSPDWTHPTQVHGGRWVLKATPSSDLKKTRDIWFELLMAVVGEQLPNAHTIAGCVLTCKQHRNEVQLWVSQPPYLEGATSPEDGGEVPSAQQQQLALVNQQAHDLKLKSLAHSMRRLLRLSDSVRMSYIPHSYELQKSRASAQEPHERQRERDERHRVRQVKEKATKSQTWPIRPPEEFAPNAPPTAGTVEPAATSAATPTSDARPKQPRTFSDRHRAQAPTSCEHTPNNKGRAGSPAVDDRLLAAMRLSANPLQDHDLPRLPPNSAQQQPPRAPLPRSPSSPVLSLASGSVSGSLTPPIGRSLIGAGSDLSESASSSCSASAQSSARATPPVLEADFHRFLITKDTARTLPTAYLPSALSPSEAPPAPLDGPLASLLGLSPPPRSDRHGQHAYSDSPPQAHSQERHASLAHAHLQPPPQRVAAGHGGTLATSLPQSLVSTSPSTPTLHAGVHLLSGASVHSAGLSPSSGRLLLPSSGQQMSRAESKLAEQWMDRVQSKQEQARSWPHNPPSKQMHQHQQQPPPPRFSKTTLAPGAHGQPAAPTSVRAMRASALAPGPGVIMPVAAIPSTSNVDLVRSRGDLLQAKSRPIEPTACPAPQSASLVFDASLPSPTAAQIYSAGVLPAIALPECSPLASSSPTRRRSRSLFGGGLSIGGSATSSPTPTSLHSPLLEAFKDVHAAAVAQAAALRHGSSTPANGDRETEGSADALTDSPPLLHLPSPLAAITMQPLSPLRTPIVVSLPTGAPVLLVAVLPVHSPSHASPVAARGLMVDSPSSIGVHASSPRLPLCESDVSLVQSDLSSVGVPARSPSPLSQSSLSPYPSRHEMSPTGSRSPTDSIEWEKRTRLDYGLPPMAPTSSAISTSFKPMSRAERKQALAMLSKVNSKRKQAQSWPRAMLIPPGQSTPSPAHTPSGGGGLALLSPVLMSPIDHGTPCESPGGTPTKSPPTSHLTVDVLTLYPTGESKSSSPSMRGLLASSPRHRLSHSQSSLGSGTPPGGAFQSAFGRSDAYGSGANTPSGAHTPGGRSVTLGVGLRSRTKSIGTPMLLTPAALGGRHTPTHNSSHASPVPSSCSSPILAGRSSLDRAFGVALPGTPLSHVAGPSTRHLTVLGSHLQGAPADTRRHSYRPEGTIAAFQLPVAALRIGSGAHADVAWRESTAATPTNSNRTKPADEQGDTHTTDVTKPENAHAAPRPPPGGERTSSSSSSGGCVIGSSLAPSVLSVVASAVPPPPPPPSPPRSLYLILLLLALVLVVMTLLLVQAREAAHLHSQLQQLLHLQGGPAHGFVAANHPPFAHQTHEHTLSDGPTTDQTHDTGEYAA